MSQDEIVAIVDGENRVVGSAPRAEMRARRLPHRASYVLVFNSRGELFVQRRTPTKDVYPGYLDPAAGGVVLAGESYEGCAERELAEELGVAGVPLTCRFDHHHRDADNEVWGRVFTCTWDGPLVLQAEEVAGGFWAEPRDLLARAAADPVTPDGLAVLQRLLEGEGPGAGPADDRTRRVTPAPGDPISPRTVSQDSETARHREVPPGGRGPGGAE